jgi:hypothetical protein
MSNLEIRTLLEKNGEEVKSLTEALLTPNNDQAVAALAGLFISIVTGVPALGGLVDKGLATIFGQSASSKLDFQIAAWNEEEKRHRLAAEIGDMVEGLLGQMLIQIVRSQHQTTERLEKTLGGMGEDLADFRADVGERMRQANVRIELQEVTDGGLGVTVTANAKKRLFVGTMRVSGKGSVGVKLE